jgi:ribulose bisphosphate carboxylase small subunit
MNGTSVLAIFDEKQVQMLKEGFKKDFHAKCAEEKKYCWEKGQERLMTSANYSEVLALLEKCKNACQVEAMNRLVLVDHIIPTWADIERVGNELLTKKLT